MLSLSLFYNVYSETAQVKHWLEIPRLLLMFSRWTRHQKQQKTFLPWWFLWQQRVFHKAVHKGKKGNLLPSSMPDGTSSFGNRHLMFSYSSIDQLINSNEAWTASEIFKRSFHWSTASSGNEKIFNNDRGECARINLEKCGQLQLIEYITVQCVWQGNLQILRQWLSISGYL